LSRDRDNRILAEYGLPPGPHPQFEIESRCASAVLKMTVICGLSRAAESRRNGRRS
jgi:hypothetical protein